MMWTICKLILLLYFCIIKCFLFVSIHVLEAKPAQGILKTQRCTSYQGEIESSLALSESTSKFSTDLLKVLCKGNTDNVVFSPLSISSALGLVVLGAKYNTAEQMLKALHLRFNHETIMYHDLYEELYKGGKNRSLKLVNRMFGESTLNFNDDYLEKCEEWSFASVRNADLKTYPEAARKQINDWVEKKTGNKIKNLLDERDVSMEDIRLVLISAVYFNDKWVEPFTLVPTYKDKGFKWPMMSRTDKFPLGKIPHRQYQRPTEARILEIPYANKDLSMLIILPNKSDGLSKLVDSITYEKLLEWTEPDNMIPTKVAVEMPLFKLQKKYDLEKVLKTLGMTDVLDQNCNLSGMASAKMKLSKVVHESFVEVNEEGTEAAGGSGADVQGVYLRKKREIEKSFVDLAAGGSGGNVQIGIESFVADHPFLFFIRHNPTKSIIFWSRFTSP